MNDTDGYVQQCTVGFVRTADGFLMFKNRDLPLRFIRNQLLIFHSTPEYYALRGVNLKTNEMEGVSIGINAHRICVANTHVASSEGVTYDLLCEELLLKATRRQDIPALVSGFVRRNILQGGKILVVAPAWAFLVEVYRKSFRMKSLRKTHAMTNAFTLSRHRRLGLPPEKPGSKSRRLTANQLIRGISTSGALKSMLRSHVPDKSNLSICCHGDICGTESSHIIQVRGDHVTWSWLNGYPCENDYGVHELALRRRS